MMIGVKPKEKCFLFFKRTQSFEIFSAYFISKRNTFLFIRHLTPPRFKSLHSYLIGGKKLWHWCSVFKEDKKFYLLEPKRKKSYTFLIYLLKKRIKMKNFGIFVIYAGVKLMNVKR